MKITCVMGSPRRNGNSATIAKAFLEEALKTTDVEIKTYELNKMNYRGCQECLKCNTELEECALNDDLSEVLESIRDSDVLVISSGVFYGDITGQLKLFIDRTYSFRHYDYERLIFTPRLKSKKLVMILTQAHPDEEMFADIFTRYNHFFNLNGFTKNYLIRKCGLSPIQKPNEDILEHARAIARQIVEAN